MPSFQRSVAVLQCCSVAVSMQLWDAGVELSCRNVGVGVAVGVGVGVGVGVSVAVGVGDGVSQRWCRLASMERQPYWHRRWVLRCRCLSIPAADHDATTTVC